MKSCRAGLGVANSVHAIGWLILHLMDCRFVVYVNVIWKLFGNKSSRERWILDLFVSPEYSVHVRLVVRCLSISEMRQMHMEIDERPEQ